ncbi:hypothetical protein ACFLU9_00610 [Chloroflexota bacterium]
MSREPGWSASSSGKLQQSGPGLEPEPEPGPGLELEPEPGLGPAVLHMRPSITKL